ncbi:MAG: hypothetical protein GY719_18725 [bacterium]|nr:hypothetical protein [bacterium]
MPRTEAEDVRYRQSFLRYFDYGSEQIAHRDQVVVPTGAPGHLLAYPSLTRKSFVVHYVTRRSYDCCGITVVARDEGSVEERSRLMETRDVIERDGCVGFENPMRGNERA